MIKECKVLSYNKFLNILVFDYSGKQVQTTAKLDTECKTVFVKYKYLIIDAFSNAQAKIEELKK